MSAGATTANDCPSAKELRVKKAKQREANSYTALGVSLVLLSTTLFYVLNIRPFHNATPCDTDIAECTRWVFTCIVLIPMWVAGILMAIANVAQNDNEPRLFAGAALFAAGLVILLGPVEHLGYWYFYLFYAGVGVLPGAIVVAAWEEMMG